MSIKKNLSDVEKSVAALEKKAHADLLKAYKKSLAGMRAELAQIYAKYEVGGTLTYAEMSKYKRLNALFDTVAGQVKDMTGETHKLTRTLSADAYQGAYYHTAFALEMESKVLLGITMLNPDAIKASVQNPLSGLTLNQRLTANRAAVEIKLREQITQGMIRGESYGDVARRIKGVLEGDAAKALRIASTETHRNYMQAMVDAASDAGDSGLKTAKVWVSSLDGVTRDSHGDMDGEESDEDGLFTLVSGENAGAQAEAPGLFSIASEDINCRCRFITVVKGYEPEKRRVRGEGVVENVTFNEWMEAR